MRLRCNLLSAFRRDRLVGFWLAALLLFVPFIQPLAEAYASGKPFAAEICSTFGLAGKAAVPGLADDCAVCIAGAHTPQPARGPDGDVTPIAPVMCVSAITVPFDAVERLSLSTRQWLKPPGRAPPSDV